MKQVMLGLTIIIILQLALITPLQSDLKIHHDDMEPMAFPSIDSHDQPMVDNKVFVPVKFNHPGFVRVYEVNGDDLGEFISMGKFQKPMPHSHSQVELHNGDMSHGEIFVMHVGVELPDNVVNKEVIAVFYNDTNANGEFDVGIDEVVKDLSDNDLSAKFSVTGSLKAKIVVQDQTIQFNKPIVTVDEIIVPGPAWLVLHEYLDGNKGNLHGTPTSLKHGINQNVELDLSSTIVSLPHEIDKPFMIFAHIHTNCYQPDEWNPGLDGHITSPEFNDTILGQEMIKAFELTITESTNFLSINFVHVIIGMMMIGFIKIKKKNLNL
jgi:hypothetical protein